MNNMGRVEALSTACRFCGGGTIPTFRETVLRRHEIQYLTCASCGSLQTERPFWLEESYDKGYLATQDTGAAARTSRNSALVWAVVRILGIRGSILDYGGGDGLLCRQLRDLGYDCYVSDKFAEPNYARGFCDETGRRYELVTSFEVFEHLVEPGFETREIFSRSDRAVLISTELYEGQGRDWCYLSLESGQHIFFYSKKALRMLAQREGFEAFFGKSFTLFTRLPLTGAQRLALRVLRHKTVIGLQCFLPLLDRPGIAKDEEYFKRGAR